MYKELLDYNKERSINEFQRDFWALNGVDFGQLEAGLANLERSGQIEAETANHFRVFLQTAVIDSQFLRQTRYPDEIAVLNRQFDDAPETIVLTPRASALLDNSDFKVVIKADAKDVEGTNNSFLDNPLLGFQSGDAYILQTVQNIQTGLIKNGLGNTVVSRLGGDEFAVLAPKRINRKTLNNACEEIDQITKDNWRPIATGQGIDFARAGVHLNIPTKPQRIQEASDRLKIQDDDSILDDYDTWLKYLIYYDPRAAKVMDLLLYSKFSDYDNLFCNIINLIVNPDFAKIVKKYQGQALIYENRDHYVLNHYGSFLSKYCFPHAVKTANSLKGFNPANKIVNFAMIDAIELQLQAHGTSNPSPAVILKVGASIYPKRNGFEEGQVMVYSGHKLLPEFPFMSFFVNSDFPVSPGGDLNATFVDIDQREAEVISKEFFTWLQSPPELEANSLADEEKRNQLLAVIFARRYSKNLAPGVANNRAIHFIQTELGIFDQKQIEWVQWHCNYFLQSQDYEYFKNALSHFFTD